jgi:hypothetical protein
MEGSSQAHEVAQSRGCCLYDPGAEQARQRISEGTITRAERVLTRPAGQRTNDALERLLFRVLSLTKSHSSGWGLRYFETGGLRGS